MNENDKDWDKEDNALTNLYFGRGPTFTLEADQYKTSFSMTIHQMVGQILVSLESMIDVE